MKELTIEQVEQVSGGIVFVFPGVLILVGDLAAGATIGAVAKGLYNRFSK
jgi:hypothetical protein